MLYKLQREAQEKYIKNKITAKELNNANSKLLNYLFDCYDDLVCISLTGFFKIKNFAIPFKITMIKKPYEFSQKYILDKYKLWTKGEEELSHFVSLFNDGCMILWGRE